jgi:hypothetical protein
MIKALYFFTLAATVWVSIGTWTLEPTRGMLIDKCQPADFNRPAHVILWPFSIAGAYLTPRGC